MRFYDYSIRGDKFGHRVAVTDTVYSGRTDFQRIDIIDTPAFGRMLLLDSHIQLSTVDEHAYHETLVHIPLLNTPTATRALVVGGGDGGVAREILRHRSIERATLVEIDQGVISACRDHLPGVSSGAFDDPRLEVVIGDAFPYLKETKDTYDLIVVDATDTYEDEEGELSQSLFTRAFYEDCRRILSPGGFLVTQADNLLHCPYSLAEIERMFKEVFPKVGAFWALVPSFGGFSGYCWASQAGIVNPKMPTSSLPSGLHYLDEITYQLAVREIPFRLPAE